ETEKHVTSWLADWMPGSVDLAGRTTMEELLAVLAASRAVVANDSGAMHLAAAVGTQGVAVFGSTDPVATGPIGAPWRLVVSSELCRPCLRRTCPMSDHPYRCMKEISPHLVLSELTELLT
ncbi:MAG: glycosyltransferase family 9 protein, partial [Victivallales bacterium]|nr:glycosyltransferase family 9 protein [Victivallales bacterium]